MHGTPLPTATDSDTEEDIRELEEDEAMTRRALDLLDSMRNDRYEAALAELREDTRECVRDPIQRRLRRTPPNVLGRVRVKPILDDVEVAR